MELAKVQIFIRQLLQEQSDLGLHFFPNLSVPVYRLFAVHFLSKQPTGIAATRCGQPRRITYPQNIDLALPALWCS